VEAGDGGYQKHLSMCRASGRRQGAKWLPGGGGKSSCTKLLGRRPFVSPAGSRPQRRAPNCPPAPPPTPAGAQNRVTRVQSKESKERQGKARKSKDKQGKAGKIKENKDKQQATGFGRPRRIFGETKNKCHRRLYRPGSSDSFWP